MVEFKPTVPANNAEATPRAAVVPVAAIRSFLAAQKVTPLAGAVGIDGAKGSLVRVICVRK
jgi:hypothetical protein